MRGFPVGRNYRIALPDAVEQADGPAQIPSGASTSSEPAKTEEARRGGWENEPWGGFNPAGTSFPLTEGTGGALSICGEVTVGFPQPITVTLNRASPAAQGAPFGNADVICLVEYAVAGARSSFELDWVNGIQASVVASKMRVQAVGVPADPSAAYNGNANPRLLISGMLGRGSRASNAPPPTRSFPVVRTPAGGIFPSVASPIPPFTRAFYLQGQDDEFDPGGVVVLRNALAQVVGEYFFNNLFDRLVLIGSTVRTWEIQNTAAPLTTSRYTLCFQLGL